MTLEAITMDKAKSLVIEWRQTILLGLFILAIAVFLRIYNITTLPIFGDEAIYIRWSQVMGAEPGLRFLPLTDGKQPLFMWILMFLVRRFSDPLFIGRLTSAFYGIATLVGIFTLTFYLFRKKKLALIAALFWAISPYSVFFDRMALVDSMLAMFGIWTLVFSTISVKTLRADYAMLAGFTLGGALLTKSPGVFFALMLPATWIISIWPKRKEGTFFGKDQLMHFGKLLLLNSTTIVIGVVIYNILRLGESFHLISSRNQDYVYPISQLWINPLIPLIPNLNSVFDWLWRMGPGLIVVFVLLKLISTIVKINFKKGIRPNSQTALIFIWTLFPLIVSSIYAKTYTSRYILFTLPTLFIFAALAFSYLYSKRELLKKVLIFGLIIWIFQSLQINQQLLTNPEKAPLPRIMRSGYLEEWTAGTGIREIAESLREDYFANPKEKIVVGTEGYFGTLPDALQAYLNDLSEITVIGVGLDFKKIPLSLIESKQSGNKTYFVVNSTRFLGDAEELGLELAAVYPKSFRPDNSRESLLLFELTDLSPL